jgi:hypothetical protein
MLHLRASTRQRWVAGLAAGSLDLFKLASFLVVCAAADFNRELPLTVLSLNTMGKKLFEAAFLQIQRAGCAHSRVEARNLVA